MEENIAKALLIAAGMLIAIMILSLLVLGYNQISNFYNEKSEKTRAEQLAEFNNQFLNYKRDNLRGTEVLTLINKVIDYNERQVYADGTGYEKVIMTVDMKNKKIVDQFKYNSSDEGIIEIKMTNNISIGTEKEKDNLLLKVTEVETLQIQEAKKVGINKLTSTKLQKLSVNISNIVLDSNSENDTTKIEKRNELLTKILGSEFQEGNKTQLQKIKEVTSQYYQYMQFKRAHFNCEEMIFDSDTGRVCEIRITIMTELNVMNNEEVVVFN